MSLTVGELQVLLSGDQRPLEKSLDRVDARAAKSEKTITAGYDRAGVDSGKALDKGIAAGLARVERSAKDSGDKAGGVLAQGIQGGLIRNSPLIAAAIGGALAAGAPVAIAAATTLFAGIGAAAAAQFPEVREAWTDLWSDIKAGAAADVAPIVPVYVGMADKIGASFEKLRPQLRDAFAASAPGIEAFTDGITGAAENAMPALVRAVERSGPVMDGLQSLLENVGTGLGGMFDAISEHSGAAGTAFDALGDIIGDLLPTLGVLLGQGAELAAIVLPPIASAMGAVADAAQALGPLLPAIAVGFAALKVGNGIGDMLGSLAGRLDTFNTSSGKVNTATTTLATGLRGIAAALPIAGVAFAMWNIHVQRSEERTRAAAEQAGLFYDSIAKGGAAAVQGAAGLEQLEAVAAKFDGFGSVGDDMREGLEQAAEAAHKTTAAMSPLELAQQNVTQKTNDLLFAQERWGEASPQAVAASAALQAAQAALEGKQTALANATRSVTQAMTEQANQALAATNAELGYQMAVDAVQGAQESYAVAVRDSGAASEEASDASLALAQSVIGAAEAAGQMAANALPATTSELQRTTTAQQGTLRELYRLRDEMGSNLPQAASNAIGRLEAAGVTLDETGAAANAVAQDMSALGASVTSIPGQKFVRIDAPTDAQEQAIRNLGYEVINLPNGDIYVAASTGDAEAALNYAARDRTARIFQTVIGSAPTPTVGRNVAGFADGGVVHQYANGGVELSPMRGGVAQVVGPNTWRVIGDRTRDDEAYIPINDDRRSQQILAQTAGRMGFGLVKAMADGGFVNFDESKDDNPAYMAWWNGLLAAGWKGRPGDNAERLYAPAAMAAPVAMAAPRAVSPTTGTGTGNVTRNYTWNGFIREEMTLRRFISLQREAEAIYG